VVVLVGSRSSELAAAALSGAGGVMGGRVIVLRGDAAHLPLPDCSVDAIVTDPPYGLAELSAAAVLQAMAAWAAGDRLYVPDGRGFMGRDWDKFVPPPGAWDECMRVLKPGGHLMAFAGSRTVDLMTLSVRIAGFEIRDSIDWIYATGFPKSLDVSKSIDKAAGAERQVVGEGARFGRGSMRNRSRVEMGYRPTEVNPDGGVSAITAPATDGTSQWEGWGTALKPAHEPIVMARKPLAGTVAANVLEHGTGALNIDGCRVSHRDDLHRTRNTALGVMNDDGWQPSRQESDGHDAGRWPPNVLLTHAEDCQPAGTRRIRTQYGRATQRSTSPRYSGAAYNNGLEGGVKEDKPIGYADADGMETVEAWDCAPGCPVAELDRQSVGGSRFFPVFQPDQVFFPVELGVCQPPGDASTTAASTSAGKRTEGSVGSSPTDGSGSRATVQFPTDTRSTTGITTRSTTTRPTSCASPPSGMTTITSDSENSIDGSMESSSAFASSAASGSRYPSTTSGEPEHGRATASHASGSTGANGSPGTGTSSTPPADHDGPQGSAASPRSFPVFRYEAKADASERPRLPDGTQWPTVKPVPLMQWLVRLVTPPGGRVLDLFCGTGTTGQACVIEGFDAVLIDRDPQALALTRVRLAKPVQPLMFSVPDPAPRARALGGGKPPPVADGQGSLFDVDGEVSA
jgi:site-specific DNA-methyltransferase (adenine-specific)